jgi:hypothetical protein
LGADDAIVKIGDLFDLWEKIIWDVVSWTTDGRICLPDLPSSALCVPLPGALALDNDFLLRFSLFAAHDRRRRRARMLGSFPPLSSR